MIAALKRVYGRFRGFDLTDSAVPPMEGALKPNTALDAAPVVLALPGVDNLVTTVDGILCSVGKELLTLEPRPQPGTATPGLAISARRTFDRDIACVASDGADALAVGLDGQGVTIDGGRHDGRTLTEFGGRPLRCPTAVLFLDPDTLVIANGSADTDAGDWKRDLMCRGRSGSVWVVDLAAGGTKAECLAERLAFPSGLALGAAGDVFVSEAWRHRVVSVGRAGGQGAPLLGDLPAYPGRLMTASDGTIWLALFAPRNSLVEFVLIEDGYRRRMVESIDPDYWIAPMLLGGRSYLEPIQGSARKKLNMLKPWSATWSCGLVAHCDGKMRPVASYHSRADGGVHGVTSLCEWGGMVFAAAKGSGKVVVIEGKRAEGSP